MILSLFILDVYSDFFKYGKYNAFNCNFSVSYTSLSIWGGDSGQSKRQKEEKGPLISDQREQNSIKRFKGWIQDVKGQRSFRGGL